MLDKEEYNGTILLDKMKVLFRPCFATTLDNHYLLIRIISDIMVNLTILEDMSLQVKR